MFVTKKEFEKFKQELNRELYNNEIPPIGRCYWREILNLKEKVEKLYNRIFGFNYEKDAISFLWFNNKRKGIIEAILDYLNVEEIEEKTDKEVKIYLRKKAK